MLYSNVMKPVTLPPGRAKLSTKPAADWVANDREHDRHGAGLLQQWPHGRGAIGQDDVRRERDQFRRVSANGGCIGCSPTGVDPNISADDPARLLQSLQERPDVRLKIRWSAVAGRSTPIRRIRSGCCALRRAATPPLYQQEREKSRRLISAPEAQDKASYRLTLALWKRPGEVRRKLMVGQPMSALGQKRTFAVQNGMSALPPIADMCAATRDVRFVPKRTSFDQLVSAPD